MLPAEQSTPPLTLYAISDHLVALLDSYDLCQTDDERNQCEAEIRQAVETQIRKVDNFCRFLAHLEAQAEFAAHEIERLQKRKAGFLKSLERLEQYAIRVMELLQVRKLDGTTARLSLRTNQPAVAIDNAELLPAQYKTIKQEVCPDKRAIKRALDSGDEVPGAHLREPSISLIRT
jgi:hypothetical protein